MGTTVMEARLRGHNYRIKTHSWEKKTVKNLQNKIKMIDTISNLFQQSSCLSDRYKKLGI